MTVQAFMARSLADLANGDREPAPAPGYLPERVAKYWQAEEDRFTDGWGLKMSNRQKFGVKQLIEVYPDGSIIEYVWSEDD